MENEWKLYLQHGDEFYQAAKDGYNSPKKFNEDTLFNLLAMSIEKMSMGFLMKNHHMPKSQTFEQLVESLNIFAPLPMGLQMEIMSLDAHQQSFCSLEVFRPAPITRDEILPIITTCKNLQAHIKENIGLEAS